MNYIAVQKYRFLIPLGANALKKENLKIKTR
jgi:hypothetical protein